MVTASNLTDNQLLLSSLALSSFRLNGEIMRVGNQLSEPVGLTSAEWQVLGAVLSEPLTISDIARKMGVTRQNVQRTAKRLFAKNCISYSENPAHKKAKLLEPTNKGRQAITDLEPSHKKLANRLVKKVGQQRLKEIVQEIQYAVEIIESMEG